MHSKIIGLITHIGKPGAPELTSELYHRLQERGLQVVLEKNTAEGIGKVSTFSVKDCASTADILLVLGGDGTILRVIHQLDGVHPPIMGVNLGSLGFLTCASSSDIEAVLHALISGNFQLSHRSMLHVTVKRKGEIIFQQCGLNDAVISRGEMSRLVKLRVRINGEILTEYNADGLIIATPTGSTAYSLSAGGPILMPDSNTHVITPICPHVLTNRSVIIGNHSEITIHPIREHQSVFLHIDGRESMPVLPGDLISITKSPHTLPIAILHNMSFSELLRQKLKWSGSNV